MLHDEHRAKTAARAHHQAGKMQPKYDITHASPRFDLCSDAADVVSRCIGVGPHAQHDAYGARPSSYSPSMRTKHTRAILPERLAQAWLVPFCTMTSPARQSVSLVSVMSVISPSNT